MHNRSARGKRSFAAVRGLMTYLAYGHYGDHFGQPAQQRGQVVVVQELEGRPLDARMKAEIDASYYSSRPMLLYNGMSWQQFGLSPKDLDWLSGVKGDIDAPLIRNTVGYTTSGRFEWQGPYMSDLGADPWGNAYQFLNPGVRGEIDVFSYGANGVPGGEGFDADIGSWNL